jgi:NitT/TauT family transport system substrate-binding protein
MTRFLTLATWICFMTVAGHVSAYAQAVRNVHVAVSGRGIVAFLPLTLAETLGYFKEAGLQVKVSDFAGGSKSIEALVGGSVDIAVSAFEHTLVLQRRGIELKAIALLNESYGAVVGIKPELAKTYKSPADLKGLKFGVTAPGSSGAMAVTIFIAKGGLKQSDVSYISIGAGPGAIAAVKNGQLDGVGQFDPMMTRFIQDGDMVVLADTRTREGVTKLYGGPIAGSAVLTTPKWLKENRETAKAFAKAMAKTVKWLHKATPEQVLAAVPPGYTGGDPETYKKIIDIAQDLWTQDGRIPLENVKVVYSMLSEFGPLKGATDIDIKAAFDNSLLDEK